MAKKYVVCLVHKERNALEQVIREGKAAAWKVQRAQALLKCDEAPEGPGWSDRQVAAEFGMTRRSLISWRKRAWEEGPSFVKLV